jgi:hypothetical protein
VASSPAARRVKMTLTVLKRSSVTAAALALSALWLTALAVVIGFEPQRKAQARQMLAPRPLIAFQQGQTEV